MLAFFLLFSMNPLTELIFRDKGFERQLPFQVALVLLFTLSTWILVNRQYIRVDSKGIVYRRWFTTHEMSWSDIESYSVSYEREMEDFLFTSYGLYNLKGKVTLKIKNRRQPIKLKIDFGSSEQRSAARTIITSYLRSLATS